MKNICNISKISRDHQKPKIFSKPPKTSQNVLKRFETPSILVKGFPKLSGITSKLLWNHLKQVETFRNAQKTLKIFNPPLKPPETSGIALKDLQNSLKIPMIALGNHTETSWKSPATSLKPFGDAVQLIMHSLAHGEPLHLLTFSVGSSLWRKHDSDVQSPQVSRTYQIRRNQVYPVFRQNSPHSLLSQISDCNEEWVHHLVSFQSQTISFTKFRQVS